MEAELMINMLILLLIVAILIILLIAMTELKTIASYLKSLFHAVERYQIDRKWLLRWENETRGKRQSDHCVRRASDSEGENHINERI